MLNVRRLYILSRIHYRRQLHKRHSDTMMSSSIWPASQQESATNRTENDLQTCNIHMMTKDSICLTCGDLPVCKVCMTTKHKGHGLKTRHQFVSKAEGPNVNDAKSSIISNMISCIEETDHNISKNKAKLQETKTKIVQQCDGIKTKADTLAELYTKQCEQCEIESTNSLQKYREDLQDLLDKYLSGKDDSSSDITASDRNIPDQMSRSRTEESTSKSCVPAPPQTYYLDFKPGTSSMEQFQKYFGDLLYCYNEIDNGLCERQSSANSTNDLAKVTQLKKVQVSSLAFNISSDRHREDKALSKPTSEQNQTTEKHGQSMHFFSESLPTHETATKSEEPNISESLHSKDHSDKNISLHSLNINDFPTSRFPVEVMTGKQQQESDSSSNNTSRRNSSSLTEEIQTNDFKLSTVSSNIVHRSYLEHEEPVSQAQPIPQSLGNEIAVAGGHSIYQTSTSPPRHMQHIFPKTIIKDMPQKPKDNFKNSKITTNKGEQQILTTTDVGYMKLSHEGKLILPDPSQKDDPETALIPSHPTPKSSQQKQYLETNLDEDNATSEPKDRSMTLLREYVLKKDLETLIKSVMPFSDHIYVWYLRKLRFNIIDKSTGKIHLKDIDTPSNVIDVYQSPVDNTIWFCCWDGSVWQITKSGNKRRMTADQSIRALCVTHEGNVVVSMDVKITLYNTRGQELKVRRRRDLQLEEKTWKIADCGHSKRLAVSDRQNIVVMDYMLNFLFKIRRGHTVVNVSGASSETGYKPHKPFEACGLCFGLDGNLLVCDTKNKMLLKFSQEGQYMETVRNVNMFPQCINRFNNQLYMAYSETLPMQVESQMTRQNQRRMTINTELLPDVAWHIQILQE